MRCGLCGGGVRGYAGTLHGRPIKDWKHSDAPAGVAPHRPILGTPVDQATLDRIHRPVVEQEATVVEEGPRPPLVAPRPATAEELESSQSVSGLLKLLEPHRWELLEPVAYFQAADGVEYMVLKARRRDLGLVVSWRRRPSKGTWELEGGYRLATGRTSQVGSEQLKDWIAQRDERCPDCGRSSVVHEGGECP